MTLENPKLYRKLMDYALNCLSRRAYSIHELSKKLSKRLMKGQAAETCPPEEAASACQQVVARLIELGYLNDLEFTERFVEERCRLKPRGRFLLTQELRRKGIPKEILAEFWEQHPLNEIPLALHWVERKKSRLKDLPFPHQQQKLFSFLASKGFSLDTIRDVLDKSRASP